MVTYVCLCLYVRAIVCACASSHRARLVLAGDPKQLGPVILSPLAQKLGLATSTMERLIHEAPYARQDHSPLQPWNTTYITKLLNNYRSHPDLLSLPNKLFYNVSSCGSLAQDRTQCRVYSWPVAKHRMLPALCAIVSCTYCIELISVSCVCLYVCCSTQGELVPMASRDQTHSLLGFKRLPNPECVWGPF